MPVVHCPKCRKPIDVASELQGKAVACPLCNGQFTVEEVRGNSGEAVRVNEPGDGDPFGFLSHPDPVGSTRNFVKRTQRGRFTSLGAHKPTGGKQRRGWGMSRWGMIVLCLGLASLLLSSCMDATVPEYPEHYHKQPWWEQGVHQDRYYNRPAAEQKWTCLACSGIVALVGAMLFGFATLAKSRDSSREERACPVCGEQILAVAVKCKHCRSMINQPQEESGKGVLVDEPSDGNPLGFLEQT